MSANASIVFEQPKLQPTLQKAQVICERAGGRLTEKRRRVLYVLLLSPVPLTAYELADAYFEYFDTKMPTMSVYRILDFLVGMHLVHRVSSASKYIACTYITCDTQHGLTQFLICERCQQVAEITVPSSIAKAIDQQAGDAGFVLAHSQLEVQCVCKTCMGIV